MKKSEAIDFMLQVEELVYGMISDDETYDHTTLTQNELIMLANGMHTATRVFAGEEDAVSPAEYAARAIVSCEDMLEVAPMLVTMQKLFNR